MRNKMPVACITILLVGILSLGIFGCDDSSTASQTTTSSSSQSTTVTSSETTSPTPSSTTQEQKYGGTLRVLTSTTGQGNIGVPWNITQTGDIIFPCIDHLIDLDFDGIDPGLATDWKIADDGTSITFTLRQGVKFQDGTDFDAAAEKWNLDKWMEAHQEGTQSWTSVEVVDTYTVRINLTEYSSWVLSSLAGGYCAPISPTAYEQNGEAWAEKNPVGTGPFKLVSMTPDVGWRYERNDGYWGSKPYLDAIAYTSITDLNAAQMMVDKGEADIWLTGTAATDAKIAMSEKGFDLVPMIAGGEPTIMVPDANNPDSPWANRNVRVAADYAINREEIAALTKGMGEPTWQIATPNCNYYDPSLTRPYNPEKARQLLADAGYPDGFSTTLNYMSMGLPTDFAVAIQSYFKDVGIILELNMVPPNVGIQLAMTGWNNGLLSRPSPAAYNFCAELSKFYGPDRMITVSALTTPELQNLIESGIKAKTLEEQKSWDIKVNKYLFDEAVSIPFYLSLYYAIKTPDVHDDGLGYSYYWTPGKCWLSK